MTTLLVRPRATQRAHAVRGGYLVEQRENPGLRRFYTQAELDRDFETVGIEQDREQMAATGTEGKR